MPWDLAIAVLSIVATVLVAAITAVWVLTARMSRDRNELAQQLTAINNSLLAQVQMLEDRIRRDIAGVVTKFDARTLEIERDLAQFKAYSERQFLSKETFNTVIAAQSSERNAMKAELIDRFNRLESRLEKMHRAVNAEGEG